MINEIYLKKNNNNYHFHSRPAIYLYGVLVAIAAVGVLFVDLDFKLPNTNLRRDIKTLIKNIELDAFLIASLLSGNTLI